MDPTKHLVPDPGCDIYNRGSYGRGCELDKVLPPSGWPPVSVGHGLTPTVITTYRPPYDVPLLPPQPSSYGPSPRYGPPPSPPVQLFPTTPSPPSSESPPKYFPSVPPTRPTGTYVPSLPPTTFFQNPGGEYTPVSVRPPGGVFKDLFDPPPTIGQVPVQWPKFGFGGKSKPTSSRSACNRPVVGPTTVAHKQRRGLTEFFRPRKPD